MGVDGYLGRVGVMMELASRHAGVNRLRFPFFSLLVFGHFIPSLFCYWLVFFILRSFFIFFPQTFSFNQSLIHIPGR